MFVPKLYSKIDIGVVFYSEIAPIKLPSFETEVTVISVPDEKVVVAPPGIEA